MNALIRDRLNRSFGLYRDLIDSIETSALAARLPGLPSNTVGEQLWCVVGARESYARAIEAGEWMGFACSLKTTSDRQNVADALQRSEEVVFGMLDRIEVMNDAQQGFALDLIEHEAAHHGQLIRYFYALRLLIPASWKSRYALA